METEIAKVIIAFLYATSGALTVGTLIAVYARSRRASKMLECHKSKRKEIQVDFRNEVKGMSGHSQEYQLAERRQRDRFIEAGIQMTTWSNVDDQIQNAIAGNPSVAASVAKRDLLFVGLSTVFATIASIWSIYL